ncbi:carboxypeptidase-like regulatory domain-containing protein [Tautonia plasticadhaerens]|uniref:Nickel uptake substrate-specific transmembrane region n=1 Tax=Tautonia plasticadhaerens TaxID=2527974 RepID=A0A518H9J1_9BACT|nr:carboxypeptidase-like regulatory domain-containing protein [Tautonia plasticadhaerens]QDV37524.1 Nickel uptake substrate-specific transmembrane region [Tautonia plasticadhaerens]
MVARGYVPASTPLLVPEEGPHEIALAPHDLDRRDPDRVLMGRVMDGGGNPVARVVIEPIGVAREQYHRFGGVDDLGIDPLAVSEDDGAFRLGVGEAGERLYLSVKAPFLAPVRLAPLAAGPEVHPIRLGVGLTVVGRVVKDGKPLPGVALGMVQQDRNSERFVGEFQFAADEDGKFGFVNIPPDEDWYLYGLMDSLKPHGAIPLRPLRTTAHGESIDLGDVEVGPGHRVSGRVVLADGGPVPPETRVLLSRDDAWDSQTAVVGPDGGFTFEGVPAERVGLSARVPGYHPSPRNASLDLLNQGGLLGMVEGDTDGLRFLLEPGPPPERDSGGFTQEDYQEYQRRRDSPLRGAPEETP